MTLRDALNEKKYDIRLRDKLTAEGKLTPEELEQYISKLSDDAQNLEPQKEE